MYNNKICNIVLNKFMLNEEAIKISNKINRNENTIIHQRLYDKYNNIK